MMRSVFVSSTFRDMHGERDVIRTKVTPAVNALAEQYGDSIMACDLRWGVDTSEMSEESSARKVLNVCLDEIDRCRPYMIVILGYRYGWIPGTELIQAAAAEKDGFALDDADISVTALEVEYGALAAAEHLERTLFYFREIDGPYDAVYETETAEHRRRLADLKARIMARPGAHVRTYHVRMDAGYEASMSAFSDMVTRDLSALMRQEWEENARLDAYALDQKKQWNLLDSKKTQFMSRESLLRACLQEMEKPGASLLLSGTPGSGKSTLLSSLGDEMQRRGQRVVPVFCSHTPLCSSGFDVLRYMVWELERALGLPHFADAAGKQVTAPAVWLEHADKLFTLYDASDLNDITFLIDGLDQLIQDDIAQDRAFLPHHPYERIRFLMSCIDEDSAGKDVQLMAVGDLTVQERSQVIRGILHARRRELADTVIEYIAQQEGARLPLYLSLVLQRLLMMSHEDFQRIAAMGDGMNAISAYQMRLVAECPRGLEAMSAYILDHASRQVGGSAMREAAILLAVSRRGLRLTDLENLMQKRGTAWMPLDAAAFIQYMGAAFIHRSDGRIDFAHKSIRLGFLQRCENELLLHREIAEWLLNLPMQDEVRMQELVWHLIHADMKEEFADTVSRMMFKKVNLPGIIKDAIDAVLTDGGAWLTEVVKEVFADNSFPHLCHFIEFHIMFSIVNSRSNLDIKRRLAELMLEAVQKRCAIHETFGGIWEISVACDRLAGIHRSYETADHLAFALKCTRHSLMLRRQLLEMCAGLDTAEKQRKHWMNELQATGLGIHQTMNAQQLQGLTDGFASEVRRGICVASEDMAAALETGDRQERLTALEHLQESLALREEVYRKDGTNAFIEDEEVELARIYGRAVQVCLGLKTDEHLRMAGEYCTRAVQLSEMSLQRGRTTERLRGWCGAYVHMAMWQEKQPGGLDKALECCLKCLPVLESIALQSRTPHSQTDLADICNRIGDLYNKKGEQEQARKFFLRSRGLVQDVAARNGSLEADRNVVIVNQRLLQDVRIDPVKGLDPETAQVIRTISRKARDILQDMRSQEACDHLNDIYKSVIRMFKAADHLEVHARERIVSELKVRLQENRLQVQQPDDQTLRQVIVGLAEEAQKIFESQGFDLQAIPLSLRELLMDMGVTPSQLTENHQARACQLIRLSLNISEDLAARTNELRDRDALVITLSKAGMIFLAGAPEEWAETNERMRTLALELMRETGKEKYTQLVALAEVVRMMRAGKTPLTKSGQPSGQGSAPRPAKAAPPAESEEISALRQRLAELQEENKKLTGLRNISARVRLKKEMDSLQQQLDKLTGKS